MFKIGAAVPDAASIAGRGSAAMARARPGQGKGMAWLGRACRGESGCGWSRYSIPHTLSTTLKAMEEDPTTGSSLLFRLGSLLSNLKILPSVFVPRHRKHHAQIARSVYLLTLPALQLLESSNYGLEELEQFAMTHSTAHYGCWSKPWMVQRLLGQKLFDSVVLGRFLHRYFY